MRASKLVSGLPANTPPHPTPPTWVLFEEGGSIVNLAIYSKPGAGLAVVLLQLSEGDQAGARGGRGGRRRGHLQREGWAGSREQGMLYCDDSARLLPPLAIC
jgi:hypothetical protein